MIRYTEQEKLDAKNARKAFKKMLKTRETETRETEPKNIISNGILEDESILNDDYLVYAGYLYVVDDVKNGIKGFVVVSDVFGTVKNLKRQLREVGYKAENIYNCSLSKRNII